MKQKILDLMTRFRHDLENGNFGKPISVEVFPDNDPLCHESYSIHVTDKVDPKVLAIINIKYENGRLVLPDQTITGNPFLPDSLTDIIDVLDIFISELNSSAA